MRDLFKFAQVVALAVLLLLPITTFAETYTAERPLKVGVLLPLTGDAATTGQGIKNAMDLAYHRLADGDRARLKLIFEDDGLVSARTISGFNKLRATEKIEAVVTISSMTSKALAPITERAQVPMIAIASDPDVVKGKKFAVNFWVSPEEEMRVVFPEMLKRSYRRVARIFTQCDGSVAVNEIFDRMNKGKVEIPVSEGLPLEVKDFRSLISKIKQTEDIDAIMLLLYPGQLAEFAKQARQQGVKQPFFGWETLEDLPEIRRAEGALNGVWFVGPGEPSSTFRDNYDTAYPGASYFGASNGFDVVQLLAYGASKVGSPLELNTVLHTVDEFNGVSGTFSSTGDNRFSLPATIKIVEGDQIQPLR